MDKLHLMAIESEIKEFKKIQMMNNRLLGGQLEILNEINKTLTTLKKYTMEVKDGIHA